MPSSQHETLPVIILCGGMGTRLREETEVRPKPMIEIGEKPILWHIMKLYACYGLTDFVLCLGYKGQMIREYFLNYKMHRSDLTVQLGMPEAIQYHTNHEEEGWRVTLVDTGQAAQTGARLARVGTHIRNDLFCLTYGDGVSDVNIESLLRFHRRHGKIGTVTGVRPPGRFGELRMGSDGLATQFNEKPQASEGIINGGFFVFQREFLERYVEDADDLVLEQEPLQRLALDGQLMIYLHEGFWQPVDTYREMRLLQRLWEMEKAPWKIWK